MKKCDNERIAQQIYASQMLKLQGKILEKKLTKTGSKNHIESQSQNISNNNSPVVGRQKSYENLQKVNKTFINQPVSQQKLSSILNVISGQQQQNTKQKYSINNELIETVKISHKLRKNQSMIHIEQQSPALTKNASFHHSVKNKINSNSVSSDQSQIQKVKEKIKLLLQERDQNLPQDAKELAFMTKFNQILNQLVVVLFQEPNLQVSQQQFNLPSSTQDTFQAIQIDHFFKRQIQILQQSYQLQLDKKKMENVLLQIKKKQEILQQENEQLSENKSQMNEQITQLKQQISELQKQNNNNQENELLESETQELKYLVQGQFEAIQKLLQREQLMKVFLKRVGDSSIIEMFEQFIQSAENVNQDDTEGNLNIDMLPQQKHSQIQKTNQQQQLQQSQQIPDKIILKYETSYKQLDLCDSLLADDSRVNDSEESSFGYLGKEQATEVSCYFTQAQQFQQQQQNPQQSQQQQNQKSKGKSNIKDKLKINMMDVQLAQAAQKHEYLKQQQMLQQQQHHDKILPDDINSEDF
ncbi:unnamed protein product [Paramecium octaurelia]|uniref:Uncharacterized protein n=1 Tax=Paramecium octaurelia TaxID=43137 RepID=A0A8S1XFY3_PAROT|nr:unnamed protein product [Paramecium octaurelia]